MKQVICPYCGTLFEKKGRAIYCSRRHQELAWNKKKRERAPTEEERKRINGNARKRLSDPTKRVLRRRKQQQAKRKRFESNPIEQYGKQRACRQRRRPEVIAALHPDSDRAKEEELHKRAKQREIETGEKWCVDHVVPLGRGGWHHHDNLQVIPLSWNSQKQDNPYWIPDPCPHWFRVSTPEDVARGGVNGTSC